VQPIPPEVLVANSLWKLQYLPKVAAPYSPAHWPTPSVLPLLPVKLYWSWVGKKISSNGWLGCQRPVSYRRTENYINFVGASRNRPLRSHPFFLFCFAIVHLRASYASSTNLRNAVIVAHGCVIPTQSHPVSSDVFRLFLAFRPCPYRHRSSLAPSWQ